MKKQRAVIEIKEKGTKKVLRTIEVLYSQEMEVDFAYRRAQIGLDHEKYEIQVKR